MHSFLKEYIDSHNNIGMVEMDLDNLEEGEKILTGGLQICDEEEVVENDDGRTRLHHNLGNVYLKLRKWDKAKKHIEKDIVICKNIGHVQGEAKGYINLGELHYRVQKYEEADLCYQKTMDLAKSMDDEHALADQINQNIEIVKEATKVMEDITKAEQNLKKLSRNMVLAKGTSGERKLLLQQNASLDRLIKKSSIIFAWKKLNEKQVTNFLKATCQRPKDREDSIMRTMQSNKYNEDDLVNKDFGMRVKELPTSISKVSVFLLLLIILLGTSLGYWLVRKYIISEDGDVDEGVAQFIKWAMRVIAVTSIFLSSMDTPLAMVAVGSSLALYYAISSIRWRNNEVPTLSKRLKLWQRSVQKTPKVGRAEFLSRPKKFSPLGSPWDGPRNSFAWSDSPVKGTVNASVDRGSPGSQQDFYSTFHKTPNRKKFSKREWVEFTEESTRESVAELASTPEFTDWMINNANRIKLLPDNGSDDDASGSDSTDGYGVKNSNRSRFFSWRRR